jgi:hypothetical protein
MQSLQASYSLVSTKAQPIFFGARVKVNGEWQTPENVAAVNTVGDEGWPYVTQDGMELWFTMTYLARANA